MQLVYESARDRWEAITRYGEPADVVTAPEQDITAADQAAELITVSPVAKRGRGRPRLGAAPLSKSERNRRWRESHGIAALEVPAAIAERIRQLREERGLSNADLLAAALDALAAQKAIINPNTLAGLDA